MLNNLLHPEPISFRGVTWIICGLACAHFWLTMLDLVLTGRF